MNNTNINKTAQIFVCFSYAIIMSLVYLAVLILFDFQFYVMIFLLVFLELGIICVCILTRHSRVNNIMHGIFVASLAITSVLVIAVYSEEYMYLHFCLILLSVILSVYEEILLNRILIYISAVIYVVAGILKKTTGGADAKKIALFVIFSCIVIIGENILKIMIQKNQRYRKVIKENSRSSQDMLKVVSMKRKEAQEAAMAKTMFLSNMSHEIRTPINAILGMDEIIIRESNEKNVIEYAERIKNAGNTLSRLINDILDFTKMESSRISIVKEKYSLKTVLDDVANLIGLKGCEKGLEISYIIDSSIPNTLYGDSVRVKQIIINIMTNGVKYTNNGSVTLNLGWRPEKEGVISLICSVSDTGIGIKEEDLDKVFDSFVRVDETKNGHIEGTGLGMSITRNLVRMMDGDITVQSEYGKGSTFTFEIKQEVIDYTGMGEYVPFRGITDNEPESVCDEHFIAPDARILVVDDNEVNITVIKGLLKNTQVRVDSASSGKQCLWLVKNNKYDIIFMDHMMPEMDGIETLREMKAMPDNMSLDAPVIALTANAVKGSREMYIEHGFTDYISKPVSAGVMENMLKKYLSEELIVPVEDNDSGMPEITRYTESFSFAKGLYYAGGDERQYMDTIEVFYNSWEKDRAALAEYERKEDWKGYENCVHSLKSSARYIGAIKLGDIAEELEKYAGLGNKSKIQSLIGEFITEWDNVLGVADKIIKLKNPERTEKPETKGLLTMEELVEYRDALIKALSGFEYGKAENLFKEILGYELPGGQREIYEQAFRELNDFNYSGARDILCKA